MRDHLEEYWPMYAFIGLFALLIAVAFHASELEQRRVNYCFDRGMVLVDTPAGKRCAMIYSMYPVGVK